MGFTKLQAARLSGCTIEQLEYWARHGIVVSKCDGFAFRDLVVLRMLRTLLEAGVPLRRVRRAVRAITDTPAELASVRLVTDGSHVWVCRDDGQILDALRQGQLALFVAVDRIAAEVDAEVRAFDRERQSFVDELTTVERG